MSCGPSDLIVGADICFWEELVDPLYQLVRQGVAAGVPEILVADPGRPPFDDLCARCVPQGDAAVLTWTMTTPTDQFVDIANRSQEAVTTAVHDWADSLTAM